MKRSWLSLLFIALSVGLLAIGTAGAATMVPITACTDCHGTDPQTNVAPIEGTERNNPARSIIGSHSYHVNTQGLTCAQCHVVPAALDHRDGKINMAASMAGGVTYSAAVAGIVTQDNQLNTTGLGTCTGTSCHSGGSPTWGTISTCQTCHGYPPVTTVADPDNKHVAGATPVNHIGTGATVNTKATFVSQHGGCQICHGTQSTTDGTGTVHDPHANYTVSTQHATGNINMNGPTAAPSATSTQYDDVTRGCNAACHANDATHRMGDSAKTITFGEYGGGGDCISCHTIAQNTSAATQALVGGAGVTQRRAIVPEFQAASNHVRNKAGGVTKQDCAVCHMEGNADGSTNGTYHKDGYIDLKDPDTGNPIQDATWGGTGAGSYTSSGTALNANATAANRLVRFSRNLASSALEIQARSIMINQCLKCHDANGATVAFNPAGTATNPFAATAASMPAGRVMDVDTHFSTANRAYHPIKGKQNNSYAYNTRMAAPWNTGVTKTAASTTGWGHLLTCWDCHASPAASGVITMTVTAHGSAITAATGSANAVELRGVVWRTGTVSATNNVTLCIVCHAGYNTSTATHHSTGSAYSSGGSSSMSMFLRYACTYCHSSNPNPATATRAGGRSADVHGYNTTYAGAAFNPTTAGYGFIRNTSTGGNGSGLQLTPARIGATTYTAACFGSAVGSNISNGTTSCGVNNMNTNQTFTVGGTY